MTLTSFTMKLTFKTVQQQTFTLDAEPTDTVADLKQKINSSQGHPVASQKIIYSGANLSNPAESLGVA